MLLTKGLDEAEQAWRTRNDVPITVPVWFIPVLNGHVGLLAEISIAAIAFTAVVIAFIIAFRATAQWPDTNGWGKKNWVPMVCTLAALWMPLVCSEVADLTSADCVAPYDAGPLDGTAPKPDASDAGYSDGSTPSDAKPDHRVTPPSAQKHSSECPCPNRISDGDARSDRD